MRIAPTLATAPATIPAMSTRLRTLPDRHGGRVVLGLLIAVLALGSASACRPR